VRDQADTLLFQGNVEVEMRNYRKSVLAFRQAAGLYGKHRDFIGQSRSRKNAAVAYGKLGEYPRAIEQATKALDLARKADDKQQVARCLATLGEMHYRLRSHQAARKLLLDAIEVARKGDYHDTLFSSYFYLWRLDSEAGDRSVPSIERVLRSLLPKLDEVLEEAEEFRRLTGLKGENEHE
jgi:tetratricopeptide (TPR) repeat protein